MKNWIAEGVASEVLIKLSIIAKPRGLKTFSVLLTFENNLHAFIDAIGSKLLSVRKRSNRCSKASVLDEWKFPLSKNLLKKKSFHAVSRKRKSY